MGIMNDTYDALVQELNDLGLQATNDPRNLRPPAVIVDPPSIVDVNGRIFQLVFPVVCVAPPSGNLDAIRPLLDMADSIIENINAATSGDPQIYTIGNTDLPAYRMTIQKTVRR